MDKKRILIWGLSDFDHLGGIERYLLQLAKTLDKNRYQLYFLVRKEKKPCFYSELSELGCEFFYITSRRTNVLKSYNDLKTIFEKERFNIIHCHLSSLSYITPCIMAKKYNIPLIIHAHNSSYPNSFLSKILHSINYYRLLFIDSIRIAVSDKAGKWMFGSKEYIIINNSIDIKLYSFCEKSRKEIRKQMHIDDKTKVILNVGSFKYEKNHSFLLSIFSKYIKQYNDDSILLLAGNGELKDKLDMQIDNLGIKNKVVFLGVVDSIGKILSASDVYVMPSLSEGYPISLIEAQCSGISCIVSNVITPEAINSDLCKALSLNNDNLWLSEINNSQIDNRPLKSKHAAEWLIEKYNNSIKIEDIYDGC